MKLTIDRQAGLFCAAVGTAFFLIPGLLLASYDNGFIQAAAAGPLFTAAFMFVVGAGCWRRNQNALPRQR